MNVPPLEIKIALVLVVLVFFVSLLPPLVRWLRRDTGEVQHEPKGWFQRGPHIVMSLHILLSLLVLVSVDVFGFLPGLQDVLTDEVLVVLAWAGVGLFTIANVIRSWGLNAQGAIFEKDLLVREGHELITDGIYRLSRHPIYVGNILGEFAVGLALLSWPLMLISVVVSIPIWNYRAAREEEMLKSEYGDEYRRYMRQTGRWTPFGG